MMKFIYRHTIIYIHVQFILQILQIVQIVRHERVPAAQLPAPPMPALQVSSDAACWPLTTTCRTPATVARSGLFQRIPREIGAAS
ncbi:hypothetical protein AJ79_08921 [Helicocarpus griseus UAMH5409]|uniref:Uncharacterized protein n=1 Tax=Helicocarpus griseus UAMH5409 TaxID=1447875 RepID=A0A2B7WNR2_9EURO|nr:hypothetical protein AJ79_08921 [Helicocarpus griseus UAMH5409]